MKIEEGHKELLRAMGLREDDFALFDGDQVSYEYDPEKGVRIYDPYYATSYDEYIGVDGWSSWNSEHDTFMSDILQGARKETRRRESLSPGPTREEITEKLAEKFGKKSSRE
jgi:hypothetical protein